MAGARRRIQRIRVHSQAGRHESVWCPMTRVLLVFALLSAAASACTCGAPPKPPGEGEGEEGEGEGDPNQNACVAVADGPGFAISAKADLRWKRAPQLQADLLSALGGGG